MVGYFRISLYLLFVSSIALVLLYFLKAADHLSQEAMRPAIWQIIRIHRLERAVGGQFRCY